jgi:hypothetical protein
MWSAAPVGTSTPRTLPSSAGSLIGPGWAETHRRARRRAQIEPVRVDEFTAQVMARVQADEKLSRLLSRAWPRHATLLPGTPR